MTWVKDRGRKLSYFAGSDYLRLSWHPEVRAAVLEGLERFGPSACASRMTTGNVPIYGCLERALSDFFGWGVATLTSAGYTAPLVAAQALAKEHTHVVLDERAHACLVDASQLTGLPVVTFPHRDAKGCGAVVRKCGRRSRALVMTDGLFTHSGEVAPLAGLVDALPASATLLVDDAHGLGVLGKRGRGSLELSGVPLRRVVLTVTLSKALGSYGGAVLGPRSLREAIFERSRLYTGSTMLPPPLAAAALASLAVLEREGATRRARLAAALSTMKEGFREAGAVAPVGPGPMFAVAPATAREVLRFRKRLLDAGIHPPLIRYPNGPADRYFRFAISSEHTPAQVSALRGVLFEQLLKKP